jgi:hypothetical protein
MFYNDKTLKTNNPENLIPFTSILVTLDRNKPGIQFIIYIKNLSKNKILGKIYNYKNDTLIINSESAQDEKDSEFVVAKIHNKKLNIIEKILKKLCDTDQKKLVRNKYAFLLKNKTIKKTEIQSKRYFQSVKLYPYWINKGSTPL